MKKTDLILISRSNRSIERSISAHKRASSKLRRDRSSENVKEERAAFAQLMGHKPDKLNVGIDYGSALSYIRYLRGVLIRRA